MVETTAVATKFKPIKMVVIGDGAVGKTSLIKCFINDSFPEEHEPTTTWTVTALK